MVTSGFVFRSEVFPNTLTSHRHSTLSFADEILDGPSGGYNLHWAFAFDRFAATAFN